MLAQEKQWRAAALRDGAAVAAAKSDVRVSFDPAAFLMDHGKPWLVAFDWGTEGGLAPGPQLGASAVELLLDR